MKCRALIGILFALVLGGHPGRAANLPPIREIVAFGDSLSDCGAFGFVPTTTPAQPWDRQLARRFGYDLEPNWIGDLPGVTHLGVTRFHPAQSCYAQSGAIIARASRELPIAGTVQLNRYLAQHKKFSGDQLVTVYLGTNDVLRSLALSTAPGQAGAAAQAKVEQAARRLVGLVDRMLDRGAKRVAVLNLYDLGKSGYDNPALSVLTDRFNATLKALLPRDPRIIPVDVHGFFSQLAADPAAYGFEHPMNDNACRDSNLFDFDCYTNPALWKSADADRTYILIGVVHFTGRTETLLADYVFRQVK